MDSRFGGNDETRRGNDGNGEGGIRTLDRVAPIQHFQCCAFDHSATSPEARLSGQARTSGPESVPM